VLLEELKVQNQTQILLLHQLLNQRTGAQDEAVLPDFNLPLETVEQLKKLEADCHDHDVRGRLVCCFKC